MFDKVLTTIGDIVVTQQRIRQLERNLEDLTYEVEDIDARLIRVEAIIELGGGGRPPPRPRRIRRQD